MPKMRTPDPKESSSELAIAIPSKPKRPSKTALARPIIPARATEAGTFLDSKSRISGKAHPFVGQRQYVAPRRSGQVEATHRRGFIRQPGSQVEGNRAER